MFRNILLINKRIRKGLKTVNKFIKRAVWILFLGGILGCSLIAIINYHVVKYADQYIVSIEDCPKSEAALVLGALVHSNGRVSDILADRLDIGIELYKKGKVAKLLLSGDHGQKDYDEVNAMKAYAVSNQVIIGDIFMDHAGFNTYESIYRAKNVFAAKQIIIVTQKYHLSRAIYIARKFGLEAYGVASDKHYYPKKDIYEARERLARCKDYVLVNFIKPKPTYLGEVIDLSGDGKVTHD
ncbi:SanA/YdcF family protein [Paramaledivibacter caminithermalis]|uniref:SanA/YdcF family protein n=1 Tax=Paramaledivibacter caminithermalis TaxID=191027 RepID=UPI002E8E4768|nr:ElyC/SanA/YdcF family protein [Paramaledivibacter caminithermalis]